MVRVPTHMEILENEKINFQARKNPGKKKNENVLEIFKYTPQSWQILPLAQSLSN